MRSHTIHIWCQKFTHCGNTDVHSKVYTVFLTVYKYTIFNITVIAFDMSCVLNIEVFAIGNYLMARIKGHFTNAIQMISKYNFRQISVSYQTSHYTIRLSTISHHSLILIFFFPSYVTIYIDPDVYYCLVFISFVISKTFTYK